MNDQRLIRNTLTVCALVIAVAAVASLLFVARNLLPLLFGAILIAVVLNRIAGKLGGRLRERLSRRTRVALVIGTLLLPTIVLAYAFANSASEQIVRLTDRVDASIGEVVQAAKEQPLVQRYVGNGSGLTSLLPSSTESLGLAKNFFATAFGGLADCLILLILAAYFGFNPDKYRSGAIRVVSIRWRDRLSTLLDDSGETLWRWMIGRVLAMLIVGCLFGAGLAVIGVPMPVELGVFAALVTFIPNLGGIAAVIPALLLASQQGSTAVISVLALYLTIQFVESYLITPMVQEHQVSLPPAAVILAQIIGGLVFGFWGVVFATPLVAVVMLWTKRLYVEGWLEA
ncbi:AI-2E family transporter [Rhodopirellula sp. JC639]|uniref:AI-2E family transporter n=1 Tax=Stieleria mannarensis TaxID=2755585 RepID=UPI0015FF40F1|nr:AI-2E family transporter [Rhodopirellula sp. JC639]